MDQRNYSLINILGVEMSNRALLATSGATLCMLGMGFAFSKVAMVTSSLLIGDKLYDIYYRSSHGQLKKAKERAEKALAELPLPQGADRDRGERAALTLLNKHLKNWKVAPEDFSGRKEDIPAAILETVIPLNQVPRDDGVRDMLLLVFKEAFCELRKEPQWAAVFVQEQLFVILKELQSVQSIMKEAQNSTDKTLSSAQDQPATIGACFKELFHIDQNSPDVSSEGSKQLYRRTYLISWLKDALRSDPNPDDHAKSMASLLHVREWNAPRLRKLKSDYNPIGLELHKRLDPHAPHTLDLVLELVANTYLNDDKASAKALLWAHRSRLMQPKTSADFQKADQASCYMVEVGEQHPDEMKLLLSDAGPRETAMTLAKWFRCFACRLSTQGLHEPSKEALSTATEEMERAKGHPEYGFVDAYIQAVFVMREWRETHKPTETLLEQVEVAERAIVDYVIEDSPIRAALSALKIEITLKRSEETGEPVDQSKILAWAGNAESMLRRSVPGYCLFSVPDLEPEMRAILDHPSEFFRKPTHRTWF